jgi:hypothetical protein
MPPASLRVKSQSWKPLKAVSVRAVIVRVVRAVRAATKS